MKCARTAFGEMRGREMVKSTAPSGPADHGIHHPESGLSLHRGRMEFSVGTGPKGRRRLGGPRRRRSLNRNCRLPWTAPLRRNRSGRSPSTESPRLRDSLSWATTSNTWSERGGKGLRGDRPPGRAQQGTGDADHEPGVALSEDSGGHFAVAINLEAPWHIHRA